MKRLILCIRKKSKKIDSNLSFILVDDNKIKLHNLHLFPKNYLAITLKNHIFIRSEYRNYFPLLVHEAVHVRQWRNERHFIIKYLYYYLKNYIKTFSHNYSYKNNPYELEASNIENLYR